MSINAVKIFYYCLFLEAVVRIIYYFSICFYLQKQRQGNLINNYEKRNMIYRTYWLYMSSMSWPIYIEFFDTLGYVVGLPSIYHLPVVTPSFCSSGSGCGCITVLHLHLEASAEEGAAAAVVRPDHYQ